MNILNLLNPINHKLFLQLEGTNPVQGVVDPLNQITSGFGNGIGSFLPNLLFGLAYLIIGAIVAKIVSGVVEGLLNKTNLDNKIATWLTGREGIDRSMAVEKWVGTFVFWLIFLFGVIAFLNALHLTAVSTPLNSFLNNIFSYLPRLVSVAFTLGIAWILATLAKAIVVRVLGQFNLEGRVAQQRRTDSTGTSLALNETLGNAVYWFILLFFLPIVLGILDLQGPLQPVQNLLNEILQAVPKILKAVIIGTIGWFVAGIVKMIVSNFLEAVGTDQVGAKIGLTGKARGGLALSDFVGTIVYVLILIPTAIAALNALQIEAISAPAVAMLGQILNALPKIFTAALILIISYVIGRFVADLATGILTSIGFNNVFTWLGLATDTPPSTTKATSLDMPPLPPEDFALNPSSSPTLPKQTPSEIVGIILLVGIVLTGAVAAVEKLEFAALTRIVNAILEVSVNVLSGIIVLAIGLYLANLAFNLILRSGGSQVQLLAQASRIAIIGFSGAMALDRMGVAPNIVNLAFGLLLGAIAVAIALAFGLGGRSVADEVLREWLASWKRK